MKRKGFTLIELMGVLIILAILGLLIVPTVDRMLKEFREDSYKDQLKSMELAAQVWASDHMLELPNQNGDIVTITLGQLKMGSYVDLDISNPKTGKQFSNTILIEIAYRQNNYEYKVVESSIEDTDETYDQNMPSITINGDTIIELTIGDSYADDGAVAKRADGTELSGVMVSYHKNGIEAPQVETDVPAIYNVMYEISDQAQTMSVMRTIIVRANKLQ